MCKNIKSYFIRVDFPYAEGVIPGSLPDGPRRDFGRQPAVKGCNECPQTPDMTNSFPGCLILMRCISVCFIGGG